MRNEIPFSGVFTIVVPKLNKGEVFEDLDMISELLRPQKPPTAQRLVEEIGEQGGSGDEDGRSIIRTYLSFYVFQPSMKRKKKARTRSSTTRNRRCVT